MSNIIRDGYTENAYIAEAEGLHSSVSFKYRPMLPEDVEATETEANRPGVDAKKAVRLIAAQVSRHLVSWDQVETDGKDAPIDFETIRRLRYSVLNKIYRVIAGLIAQDSPPSSSPVGSKDMADAIIAEASGKPPGQEAAEADLKN